MRRASLACLAIATAFASFGCQGKSAETAPQNAEQALGKLSAEHRQNFENWKKRPLKSCVASEVLSPRAGSLSPPESGVDGAVLLVANAGSMVFADGQGFTAIASTASLSGVSDSKADQSEEIDGKTYSVSVASRREGSHCVVSIYGQKVYETEIVAALIVGAHWRPDRKAQATSPAPQIRALPSGAAEAMQHGVFTLVQDALKPSREAVGPIARRLGVAESDLDRFVQTAGYASLGATLRVQYEPTAVWTDGQAGNLIARETVLRWAFDGSVRALPVEARLALPQFTFGAVKNDADAASWKILVNVAISGGAGGGLAYQATSVAPQGLVPFDADEAKLCVDARATALVGSATYPQQELRPSTREMLGPCLALGRDVEKIAYDAGLMRALVPRVLAGVMPSPQIRYGGWDDVVSRLALEALARGEDVRAALDPAGRTRVVPLAADHLRSLKQELQQAPKLAAAMQDDVYRMGLTWTFAGQSASPGRMRQIVQAGENAVDPFAASTSRLVRDLGSDPDSQRDAIAFAQTLVPAYKVEATRALALASELNYRDFERDEFATVLQRRPSIDAFRASSAGFETIRNELRNYPNVAGVKGDLVGLSIKWLRSGEASARDLAPIYSALNNAAVPFEQSSRTLMSALSQSLSANRDALTFAASLSPEYKAQAIAIRDNSAAVDYADRGREFFNTILQRRPAPDVVRAHNALWAAALAFTARERARTAGEFGGSAEWDRKDVVRHAVDEAWSDAEFTGLEAISETARSKNTCERQKSASSLAKCVDSSLRLFSTKSGMFFDPTLAGRYTGLGREFAGYLGRLSAFEWTNLRWTMVGAFFGSSEPIWSKCAAAPFTAKASALRGQVDAIASTSDQFRKWELERQIKETLENCR